MDCRWRTGVGVMGWLHTRTGIAAGIVWHTYSAQADASGGGATSPSAPRGGNVIHDNICACRRHYSQHRRYGIGCDQETKSPSQRPAGSGRRSAQRCALQPIQSLAHRRRQPWLQSKPHDLEVKPAFRIAEADPLLAGCPRHASARWVHGLKCVAFTRARSLLPARAD